MTLLCRVMLFISICSLIKLYCDCLIDENYSLLKKFVVRLALNSSDQFNGVVMALQKLPYIYRQTCCHVPNLNNGIITTWTAVAI